MMASYWDISWNYDIDKPLFCMVEYHAHEISMTWSILLRLLSFTSESKFALIRSRRDVVHISTTFLNCCSCCCHRTPRWVANDLLKKSKILLMNRIVQYITKNYSNNRYTHLLQLNSWTTLSFIIIRITKTFQIKELATPDILERFNQLG